MRQTFLLCTPLLAILALASSANAATLYVSPTATATSCCSTREAPCTLGAAATLAMAGDTVILMDGVYTEGLWVPNSGTESAWITFQADECATPILEGLGAGPTDDIQDSGVGSDVAEYVRFKGIVSRGWNIGFGNGWAGGLESDEVSNGHWEIEHCISYSNGRTGFTFFSAPGFVLKNSIAAHNGSSTVHSWSSGVTLFEASGTTNRVEGTISFENTDAERNTDGSGFIVDRDSNGATFLNNIAFGNAGSCLRLTESSGTVFVNNTCYHNSQFGSRATGPTNPGEIYFTNGGITQEGVTFMNNVIVGTGQAPAGSMPIQNQPPQGWTNNVVTTGSVSYFTDPTGTNPNFVPAMGDTMLTGKAGTGSAVPMGDSGFDPKCIVKRTPVMVGMVAAESWWQYDIDIEYIKTLGGVSGCFTAATRSSPTDIGAYKAGTVTTVAPGSCMPTDAAGAGGASPSCDMGGAGGLGGAAGSAGDVGVAGTTPVAGGTGVGGAGVGGTSSAGTAGVPGAGTTGVSGANAAGATGTAGTATATGGSGGGATGGSTSAGGSTPGTPGTSGEDSAEAAGCGCRVRPDRSGSLTALGLLGLGLFALGRRRRAQRSA